MIKGLLAIVVMVLLAAFGIWLYEHPGAVQIVWLGYELTSGIGVFAGFIVLLGISSALLFWLFGRIFSLPAMLLRRYRNRQKTRALEELQACLVAIAGGKKQAMKHAIRSAELLGEEDVMLGHLLQAMAALSVGDVGVAEPHYRKLSENSKTAFIGFNGLAKTEQLQGNIKGAIEYALKARDIDSETPENQRMLVQLYGQQKQYKEAITILENATHDKTWKRQDTTSHIAKLYGKMAEQAKAKGDIVAAIGFAESAHKRSPHMPETIIGLAKLYGISGNIGKAEKILKPLFDDNMPQALSAYNDILLKIYPVNSKDGELKRLSQAEKTLSHYTSNIEVSHFLAELCLQSQIWGKARGLLEAVDSHKHNALHCRLMVRLEQGEGQHPASIPMWQEKAKAFENMA